MTRYRPLDLTTTWGAIESLTLSTLTVVAGVLLWRIARRRTREDRARRAA